LVADIIIKENCPPLDEEIKKDNKIVTGWLLYYHERKRNYLHQRENIIYEQQTQKESLVRGRPYISDTTAKKAIKLIDLEKTEEWLQLIEEIEKRLPWKLQIILKLRRESKYVTNYWRIYVQRRYVKEVSRLTKKNEEDVWVSEEQIRQFWDKIVNYTARLAGKKGLLP